MYKAAVILMAGIRTLTVQNISQTRAEMSVTIIRARLRLVIIGQSGTKFSENETLVIFHRHGSGDHTDKHDRQRFKSNYLTDQLPEKHKCYVGKIMRLFHE